MEVFALKRIIAACIEQTLHFQLKDGVEEKNALDELRAEIENYKRQLERKRTKYKIISEEIQPDGSVIVKIKKQYNYYDCGDYLN